MVGKGSVSGSAMGAPTDPVLFNKTAKVLQHNLTAYSAGLATWDALNGSLQQLISRYYNQRQQLALFASPEYHFPVSSLLSPSPSPCRAGLVGAQHLREVQEAHSLVEQISLAVDGLGTCLGSFFVILASLREYYCQLLRDHYGIAVVDGALSVPAAATVAMVVHKKKQQQQQHRKTTQNGAADTKTQLPQEEQDREEEEEDHDEEEQQDREKDTETFTVIDDDDISLWFQQTIVADDANQVTALDQADGASPSTSPLLRLDDLLSTDGFDTTTTTLHAMFPSSVHSDNNNNHHHHNNNTSSASPHHVVLRACAGIHNELGALLAQFATHYERTKVFVANVLAPSQRQFQCKFALTSGVSDIASSQLCPRDDNALPHGTSPPHGINNNDNNNNDNFPQLHFNASRGDPTHALAAQQPLTTKPVLQNHATASEADSSISRQDMLQIVQFFEFQPDVGVAHRQLLLRLWDASIKYHLAI